MYNLIFTQTYERAEKRFLKKHPELIKRYKNVLRLLELEPDHPSLKLHSLSGKFAGKHAVSVTFSYRIMLSFAKLEDEIVLLSVGSHDEVYR